MIQLTQLSPEILAYLALSVFVAGVIRGFTGFAASAAIMAMAAIFIAPLELLPICLLLEIAASAFLVRGSIKEADIGLTVTMTGAAFLGLPLGLYMLKTMNPDLSRLVVLGLVVGLAGLQLLRIPLPLGTGRAGQAIAGFLAGVVHGVASFGGLVQALYVMALNRPVRAMRATMILGVLVSSALALFWQSAMGVLTILSLMRVAAVLLPFLLGLWLGHRHFTPANERHYRPISLGVLVILAGLGILRLVI